MFNNYNKILYVDSSLNKTEIAYIELYKTRADNPILSINHSNSFLHVFEYKDGFKDFNFDFIIAYIKRLFNITRSDVIFVECSGISKGALDRLMCETKDEEYGVTYPAYTTVDKNDDFNVLIPHKFGSFINLKGLRRKDGLTRKDILKKVYCDENGNEIESE